MSRYFIDADLTSMISACQDDASDLEVHFFQENELPFLHLDSGKFLIPVRLASNIVKTIAV